MYYTHVDTPVGTALLVSDGKVLTGLHWKVFKRAPTARPDWIEDKRVFHEVLTQLFEYFAGTRQTFDLAYEARGTDFQKDVWRELEKIPYGTISSYQKIATTIGRPRAVRAVGTAIGSNPISIILPCHRVLTSTGRLGGYAGGLPSKAALLRYENVIPNVDRSHKRS